MRKNLFRSLVLAGTILLISSQFQIARGVMQDDHLQTSISGVAFAFHADELMGNQLPDYSCQVCHPEPLSNSMRKIMLATDISCTDCHITMTALEDPNLVLGMKMPSCTACHDQDHLISALSSENNTAGLRPASPGMLYAMNLVNQDNGDGCDSNTAEYLDSPSSATACDYQPHLKASFLSGLTLECHECHSQFNQADVWHSSGEY